LTSHPLAIDLFGQFERQRFRDRHRGTRCVGLQLLGRVLHGRPDDAAHEVDVGDPQPACLGQA